MPSLPAPLLRCRRGATSIEYALIVAFVFLAAVGGVSVLGGGTHGLWGGIANRIQAVI